MEQKNPRLHQLIEMIRFEVHEMESIILTNPVKDDAMGNTVEGSWDYLDGLLPLLAQAGATERHVELLRVSIKQVESRARFYAMGWAHLGDRDYTSGESNEEDVEWGLTPLRLARRVFVNSLERVLNGE